MKILAAECSATPASCAIVSDSKILASSFTNVKLTHSQTLLPMIDSLLRASKTDLNGIDGFCVSFGPGSFTGIRIGISAIKGLAQAGNIPCAGVSTLHAMAQNLRGMDVIACCTMDARCHQLYNALFRVSPAGITRLCEDRAISVENLAGRLEADSQDCPIVILGDGAELFYPYVRHLDRVSLADETRRYQNAVGVALCAEEIFRQNKGVPAAELLPFYLRPPQAERQRERKEET